MTILPAMLTNGAVRTEAVRLAMGIGVLGVTVTGLTTVATGAFFGDHQTGTYGFTSGTVKLGVSPASAALALGNMAPGDSTTGAITVSNVGTLRERYSATVTTSESGVDNGITAGSGSLGSVLGLQIKTGATCTAAGFAGTGTAIYSGSLAGIQGQSVVTNRELDANASETLCAQVTFPKTAGNEYANKSLTATVVFNSEQTANNPLPHPSGN